MDDLFAIASAAFYIIAIVTIIPGILNQKGIKAKTVLFSATAALALHFWLLGDLIIHTSGQNLSILNVASLVSFIISLSMTISTLKVRLWFLLPVVYSFSAINLAAATFLPGTFITHLEHRPELLVHIALALSAYATLMIGALYALQLAWLDHKLKKKKALAINPNLPPLMMVERQLFRIILFGNVLLTGTLVTGFVYIEEVFSKGNMHKGVLSFVAWIVYSILLWGHYQKGWRGRRVTWLAIVGAFILTLAYFGSRFVREFILS
ncbi:inner membrane protein YpjD [Vibrio sp.]|uniref:Inner membrane protein YpjD n=1 Tax=Vibrio viridaestus TaxID=2487322 RepID=A0A3N9TFC9_9VIBR|nr:inner membrane protein YpjD [Vibrio viridaestus]MDC0609253.1 inner membrane protein YpjD [Vibrio sp.]RQW62941.1 inner membrane protein YpjD [Vibrio viridaestus]